MKKISDISYFQGTNRLANGESGRSLVEMLGTIAIITMITIGSITAGSVAMTTWRTNELRDDLDVMIQTIADLYSWNREGFSENGDEIEKFLCKEGDFHRCVCEEPGCISTPWDGEIVIKGIDGNSFEIEVLGIPAMACRQLLHTSGHYWEYQKITSTSREDECPVRGNVDILFKLKDNF